MIKNSLLVVLPAVFLILCVEFALRLFSPLYLVGSNDFYQYDSELGYVGKPGHHFKAKDYQLESMVNVSGNIGFYENFSKYDKLIFTIGDSYTEGVGVPVDASYPFHLDLLLNIDSKTRSYEKRFAVANFGLSGRGGLQNKLVIQKYSKDIGVPNYILYLGFDNDADDDVRFLSGAAEKSIISGSPYWGVFYPIVNYFLVETEIGKRLKYVVHIYRERSISPTENGNGNEDVSVSERQIEVLRQIFDIAKAQNSTLIVSWAVENEAYEYMKKFAAENNVHFADWNSSVESVIRSMPKVEKENLHSGGHYRSFVNYLIALAFVEEIKMVELSNKEGK